MFSRRVIPFVVAMTMSLLIAGMALGDVIDIKVIKDANDYDDVEQHLNDNRLDRGSSDLEIPYEDSGDPATDEQVIGLRFLDIPIGLGADVVVDRAYIEVTADKVDKTGSTNPVNVIIEGQLVPNAEEFADEASNVTDRARTAAQVKWSIPAWTVQDSKWQSSDISPIIQEIISQEGWAPGNNLVLIIRDDKDNPSTGLREAESSDDKKDAPLLHVEFRSRLVAGGPSPASGVTDLPYYKDEFSWLPGDLAVTHTVYASTDIDEVTNGAAEALFADGLAQTNLIVPSEVMMSLLGQTVYWRVDGVGADAVVYPGSVWNFTLEPVSLPITDVMATASDANPEMGPEKTIDGSGLTDGQHGNEATDMWLAPGDNPWIQYEFGQVEILNDMSVWNSNQPIESFLGFGMKEIVIEISVDGENWTAVEGATEFAQATSLPDYTANSVVDFAGAAAKYVRITGQSAFGMSGQMGLSEVRFSSIRAYPSELAPASDTHLNGLTSDLSWRAGRFAVEHQVVVDGEVIDTTTDKMSAVSLNYGDVAVWQVVDVAADGTAYASEENVLFAPTEGVIATIGEDLGYKLGGPDSTWLVKKFNPPLDITVGNPDAVSVLYRGFNNPEPLKQKGDEFTISSEGNDIWNNADQFRFVYKSLSGDGSITAKINSAVEANEWTKVGVMIRDSVDADSANSFSFVTPNGRVGAQWRHVAGESTNSVRLEPGSISLPYYVRLTRTGNMLKGEHSTDGVTWSPVGVEGDPNEKEVIMGADVTIGLAVTSHSSGNYTEADISDVSTTGAVSGGWQVKAIGKDMPSPNKGGRVFVVIGSKNGNSKHIQAPTGSTLSPDWTPLVVGPDDLGSVDPTKITYMRVGVEGGKGAKGVINVGNVIASSAPED
jgi:hypothetical protein